MKARVLVTTALLLTLTPLTITSASAAKAPSAQSASSTCTSLYAYAAKPVKEPKGLTVYPVFITNIAARSCVLAGVPSLTYTPAAATAARVYVKNRGQALTLAANGGAINVLISVTPTTKWPSATCGPVKTRVAKLSFGPHTLNVATSFPACSKLHSTTISGVATLSVPIN